MDLHTIQAVRRPLSPETVPPWRNGFGWLAGGTWLFSEPQVALDTLIDVEAFGWEPLHVSPAGLDIAATCRIGAIDAMPVPPEWPAAVLFSECARSLLMSFKVANVATVGGNICMSLPAGAMISLTAALEGVCTLWPRDGAERQVRVVDFVTGNHKNILEPGELLRSVHLPASALGKRCAFRRLSLTHLGRSAALIIGTQTRGSDDLLLTITAATPRPVQIAFDHMPTAYALREAIEAHVDPDGWFDDVHGSAPYKRHLTFAFAEQIRHELDQTPDIRA